MPQQNKTTREGRTCARLCQDNALVMPDKVINSYVCARSRVGIDLVPAKLKHMQKCTQKGSRLLG